LDQPKVAMYYRKSTGRVAVLPGGKKSDQLIN
jgi:hypothetical protein